jgi:hypothetical protein
MKIQSAGRLGNQLFVFGHALDLKMNSGVESVSIFADKFHSRHDKELFTTFNLLSNQGVKFTINNWLGFLLKVIDKLNLNSKKTSGLIRRILRIQTETEDVLTKHAWIQRGFFQEEPLPENVLIRMNEILTATLKSDVLQQSLRARMPFLLGEYQAIHVRRTDFFSTELGVIDPKSQLDSLQNGLKVVICTDATKEEISNKVGITDFEVITPAESTAWETLAVLSGANYLVMSNSTLSYWAGLVASKAGKNVCAPTVWNKQKKEPMRLPYHCQSHYVPVFENL